MRPAFRLTVRCRGTLPFYGETGEKGAVAHARKGSKSWPTILHSIPWGLAEAISKHGEIFTNGASADIQFQPFVAGSIYCGQCRGLRRVRISGSVWFDLKGLVYPGIGLSLKVRFLTTPVPALFRYACIQCDAAWSVLVYPAQGDLRLALLPVHFGVGGIASANTPEGVAYCLDQAARCHSISANSAAMTMFRSALEWVLEEQGFKDRMLGPKLAALDQAIAKGSAPPWASEIDPEYLKVIKDLGNFATHTNAGDLTKQETLDSQLYRKVELTFLELLDVIYDRPVRKAQLLAELKEASGGR